ncbi:MAG: hypothetical protein LCH41_10745 [Armatimonadetes bacterium]|nr:hypothetical protein [Armatimonadota bacterium]
MNSEILVHQLLRGLNDLQPSPDRPSGAGLRSPSPYPFIESSSYELTITAAQSLNVPVMGTVSGGASKRVVVLERRAYRKQPVAGGVEYIGYTIRLAVTVNRLEANAKLSLPFLAASAEIGQIEGRWTVQVVGLTGPKIDEALIPPAELSVEQYFKAKECLRLLIEALSDPSTTIQEQRIFMEPAADLDQMRSDEALGRAYGLSCLDRRWRLQRALAEVVGARQALLDAVTSTYSQVAGITGELEDIPPSAQIEARRLLGEIREVNPR